MRKFYAFMLLMAMMVPFGASAQTMTEENGLSGKSMGVSLKYFEYIQILTTFVIC